MMRILIVAGLVGVLGWRLTEGRLLTTRCPAPPLAEPDAEVLCAALPELTKWVDKWDEGKPIVFDDSAAVPEFPWSENQAALAAAADPHFDPFRGPVPNEDLQVGDGQVVHWELIESAQVRSAALKVLPQPTCGNIIMVDGRQLHNLYRADVPAGWRTFWRLFPRSFGTVSCSAPGYDSSGASAVVTCNHMMGALEGVGVFIMLERQNGVWKARWSKSLWVA